jgi:hypothetical protein
LRAALVEDAYAFTALEIFFSPSAVRLATPAANFAEAVPTLAAVAMEVEASSAEYLCPALDLQAGAGASAAE